MARGNDQKRVEDYIRQRRMDLVFLTNLPSLRMFLMDYKLGLQEEAAFVKDDVESYLGNYLKNLQPPFPHTLSVVSINGKELLRFRNGEIVPIQQDAPDSLYLEIMKKSKSGRVLPLPNLTYSGLGSIPLVDFLPVYSEINRESIGGIAYKYEVPFDQIMQHSKEVIIFNSLFALATILIACGMIYFALEVITKPLIHLTNAAEGMIEGDLSKPIEIEGRGETRKLAIVFESLRRRMEDFIGELQRNERKLKSIIDFLPDATLIIDRKGQVIFWNKAIEEMTGCPRDYMVGRKDMEYAAVFYGRNHPVLIDVALDRSLRNPIADGQVQKYINFKEEGNIIQGSAWCSTVKGRNRLLSATASALYDDQGNVFGAIECIRDITDNYKMEQEKDKLHAQLLHAQKMEAMGTLAGGIAHDFNNLIQAISGYTELLMMEDGMSQGSLEMLESIGKSSRRASELTKQLLLFSRKTESSLQPMDLNKEINEMYSLLQRTIPKMITIELQLADDLGVVNGDPVQFEQIVMNLAINARDAMPEGGRITIETSNAYLDEKFCELNHGAKPGEYALLSIRDTGEGMAQEILAHIFEPFFTTKKVGKGTGLGLSMVYGIVNAHGGYISCSSLPGQGTAFSIYLPAAVSENQVDEQKSCDIIERGEGTILLVDDEEHLRSLGAEFLTRFGYKVLVESDGERALECYRLKQQQIDLVIMDMIMPGMGGKKCIEEMVRINPGVKVIIASGYTSQEPSSEIISSKRVTFIRKPYRMTDMLKIVGEAICCKE